MKQTDGKKMTEPQAKRGRGRPRIENPLSAAERARRYRERKRQSGASGSKADGASKRAAASGSELMRLQAELQVLQEFQRQSHAEVATLRQENADLRGLVDMFINARLKSKPIPADVFRNICAAYLGK